MVETQQNCAPCSGNIAVLTPQAAAAHLETIGAEWQLDGAGKVLERRFKFKGFAKATYLANLCAWLADKEGHHPDISFGFGYVVVRLTTHDIDGLSENDFIWAGKLNGMLN